MINWGDCSGVKFGTLRMARCYVLWLVHTYLHKHSLLFQVHQNLLGDFGLLLFCLYFFEQYLSELMGKVAESERGKFLRNVHGTIPWDISQQLCAMASCARWLSSTVGEYTHTPQHVSVWECVFTCVHTCVPKCIWECASEHIPSKASASVACRTLLGPVSLQAWEKCLVSCGQIGNTLTLQKLICSQCL